MQGLMYLSFPFGLCLDLSPSQRSAIYLIIAVLFILISAKGILPPPPLLLLLLLLPSNQTTDILVRE